MLPPAKPNSHSQTVRIILTFLMFAGLAMILVSILKPRGSLASFWHPSFVLGFGGLILASVSAFLRGAERTPSVNKDGLRSWELLCLVVLALTVIAADIHYSQKIGLLAFPPYYDGVEYMCAAKYAILSQATWPQHPMRVGFVMFGNRFPLWKILLFLNFRVFGVGEWQAYAVRFWPILIILATTHWVVRRRTNSLVAWAAALFTALLPTLSSNLLSAALGRQIFPRGYLADLRPDILYAALLMVCAAVMIEHAGSFDEWTALLAGTAAALAILTKATASSAVVLAVGVCLAFVLYRNRSNLRKTLQTMMWALLPFTLLLLPWLLAGGLENAFVYTRRILTTYLPAYSNPHPTFRSEFTYYLPWLVIHMGWLTVVLAAVTSILLLLAQIKGRLEKSIAQRQLLYLLLAAALYTLVSLTPAKNYFLGLPFYLLLWLYCWGSLASLLALLRSAKAEWGLLSLTIITAAITGVGAARGIRSWKGHEFEEGRQDRAAFQQMARDLRQVLSNDQSFVSIPAYGSPDTLLFYMPDREGAFPQESFVGELGGVAIPEFIRETVQPAKAVLVLSGGSEARGFKEVGAHAPSETYYRAIAEWVRRPDSSFHLLKSYELYGDAPAAKSSVELYVRND